MYTYTNFENQLDQVANPVQQQDLRFSSLGDAQRHLKKIKN